MASLDIILNVEGTSDINKLVDQINRLDAQTKKMYKAFAAGNITMREAKASFQQVDGVTEELTDSMDRLFDTMRKDAAVKQHIKGLNNLGVALKRVAKRELELQKAAEERRKAEERREQKLDAAAEKARRRYDPVYGATKKLEEALGDIELAQARQGMSAEVAAKQTEHLRKDYDKFVAAIKTGNMRLIDGGNQFAVFGNAAYQSQRKVQKFASSVGQQFGYQIQDFFVQIQSGTDILVALGQQGSQLLGIFGTKGALAGALLAIGTMVAGIGAAAYQSLMGLKEFKDSLDELADTRNDLEEFFEFLGQKPEEIADKFQMAIDKVIELRKLLIEEDIANVQEQAEENLSSANKFLRSPAGLELPPSVIANRFKITSDRTAMEQLSGLVSGEVLPQFSREQLGLLREYQRVAKEVLAAEDPLQRLSAFEKLEKTLSDLGVSTDKLPEDFIKVKTELASLALEYDRTTLALEKINARIAGVDFKTGFARALEQGQIDLDELMPPVDTEGRATSRQDSLQKRFEQLGMQRQYMSRAFGSGIIKAAQAGFEIESKGITETEKLRRKLQIENDGIRQKFYERRRVANRREAEEQKKLNNQVSETEKLRRRLQARSTKIIQEAEKRHRVRRRREEQEAAEKRVRDEERIREEESRRRTKNITERVKKDAIPPFDPRVFGFDKIEAEAYKLQNGLESNSIDFEKRRTDRIMREYAKVAKSRIDYNNTVAEEQAERDQEVLRRQRAAEESLTRLQNGRLYASRAYNSEIIQASQERTEEELAAQQNFLEGIQKALQEGQKLSELDMKSPYDNALLSARELSDLMEISLSQALTIINAIEQAKTGPVSGGKGRTLPTASDILMMSMGGEYIPYDKTDKTGKTDYQRLLEDYSNYITGLKFETKVQSQLIGLFGEERAIQEELIRTKEKYKALGQVFNEQEIEQELRKQEAFRKTQEILEDNKRRQEELADTMASHFEDAFMSIIDHTKSAEEKFKEFASAVIKDLYRILVVQQMVGSFDAATGKGSGIAGFIGGLLKRENGGPVSAGTPYLVGERGPELFVPNSNGSIVPNNKMSSGGTTVVQNINISTGVQQTVRTEIRQLMPQIAESAKAAVVEGKRRGGNYGRSFA